MNNVNGQLFTAVKKMRRRLAGFVFQFKMLHALAVHYTVEEG
jgi:hypothetical protein